MMQCREYIFLLSSGQLKTAGISLRLQAKVHRMGCRICREFTNNNATLDTVLADYRERLETSKPARKD